MSVHRPVSGDNGGQTAYFRLCDALWVGCVPPIGVISRAVDLADRSVRDPGLC